MPHIFSSLVLERGGIWPKRWPKFHKCLGQSSEIDLR